VDVDNEKPAKESRNFFQKTWDYLVSKGNPLRIWRPIDNILIIGSSILMIVGMGQFMVSRPGAPVDKNGRKYVVFQEIFQKKAINDDKKQMDSLSMLNKVSADVLTQYKNGDSAMVAAIGQARVKLKKAQARNDSIAKMYQTRNDSIKKSYAIKAMHRADSIKAKAAKQVRMPQKH